MKCPKCGKEIANDSLFCEYCGTQTKRGSKQVDIRWCLLPAMIIATIAMGFAAESWDICEFGGTDHSVEPFFVIPLCLFVLSCWYAIKKLVPLSFIIMIVILFGINCKILYDSENTRNTYKFNVDVSWDRDGDVYEGGSGSISLYTLSNYSIKNVQKAKEELLNCALSIKDKLKGEGYKGISLSQIFREDHYHTGWRGEDAFFWLSIFLIIYLIYAAIAHKRGWTF